MHQVNDKKVKINLTFLGTSQHRTSHHTLLTEMHDAIQKHDSNIHSHLLDGVGCRGTDEDPTPGTYEVAFADGQILKRAISNVSEKVVSSAQQIDDESPEVADVKVSPGSSLYKEMQKFIEVLDLARKKVFGEGVDANVIEAVKYVGQLLEKGNIDPDNDEIELTLAGFSRGADSCPRVANALKKIYPSLKIRMTLIDPVPGPGRTQDEDSFIIPDNVERFDIVVMANEHMPVLLPHDMDSYIFEGNPVLNYRIFPGNHGAASIRKPGRVVGSDAAYKLQQDAMLRFYIDAGLLPKDHVITHEYGLVNGKFIKKELSVDRKYVFCDLSDITEDITYKDAIYAMNDLEADGIVYHQGKFLFVDQVYGSIEEINLERLSKDNQDFLKLLLQKQGDIFKYLDIDEKSLFAKIREIVSPREYKLLSDVDRFKTYCEAYIDMGLKAKRARVEKNYYFRRAFKRRMYHVHDAEIFVDEEHRQLFMQLYPDLYNFYSGQVAESDDLRLKVKNQLETLYKMSPTFANNFASVFNIDILKTLVQNKLEVPKRTLYVRESSAGKKLKHDSLAYLQASCRNIINYYGFSSTKNKVEKALLDNLRRTLDAVSMGYEKNPEKALRDQLEQISKSAPRGFLRQEVKKIILEPNKMLADLRLNINARLNTESVSEDEKKIIKYYANHVLAEGNKKFSWDNYLKIRDDMIHLHAQFAKIKRIGVKGVNLSDDFDNIVKAFIQVDHGAKTKADKLIEKLEAYQRRSKLYSYFPMFFGWFDKSKYDKLDKLIESLQFLNSKNLGDDLYSLKDYIHASMHAIFDDNVMQNSSSKMNKSLLKILQKGLEECEVVGLREILEEDNSPSQRLQ